MTERNQQMLRKWQIYTLVYLLLCGISCLLCMATITVLIELQNIIAFSDSLVLVAGSVFCIAAAVCYDRYLKKLGAGKPECDPLQMKTPFEGKEELFRRVQGHVKSKHLKQIGQCWCGSAESKKKLRIYLFDFTEYQHYDTAFVNQQLDMIYDKCGIFIPKCMPEARNKLRICFFVFRALPESAEIDMRRNALYAMGAYDTGRPFTELTLPVYVDLSRNYMSIPFCKTVSLYDLKIYSFLLTQLQKMHLLGQGNG